jgi:putative membrane protein
MRIPTAFSLITATALLAAAATVAQPQTTTRGTTGTDTKTSTSSVTAGSGTLRGQDAEFLRKAAQAGYEEVQNAQMALQSAQLAETRNAASIMLEDHQRANEQLASLAQGKGWSMPSTSDMESDQARDQSRSSTDAGSDFDSRYVSEEIRHHREAIALYRAQVAGGSDPDLRRFAQESLPKLEHHLDMLEGANTRK